MGMLYVQCAHKFVTPQSSCSLLNNVTLIIRRNIKYSAKPKNCDGKVEIEEINLLCVFLVLSSLLHLFRVLNSFPLPG